MNALIEKCSGTLLFICLLAGALVIWSICGALPARVASHFGRGGSADSFTTIEQFRVAFLGFSVGLPLFVALISQLVYRFVPPSLINIPNRDYWLAPERRAQVMTFLSGHANAMGIALMAFIVYLAWLIAEAHRTDPPRLDEGAMFGGIVGLILLLGALIILLVRRFRTLPQNTPESTRPTIARPQRPGRPR